MSSKILLFTVRNWNLHRNYWGHACLWTRVWQTICRCLLVCQSLFRTSSVKCLFSYKNKIQVIFKCYELSAKKLFEQYLVLTRRRRLPSERDVRQPPAVAHPLLWSPISYRPTPAQTHQLQASFLVCKVQKFRVSYHKIGILLRNYPGNLFARRLDRT